MESPDVIQRFKLNGLETATSTAERHVDITRNDLQTWRKLMKDANLTIGSAA